MFLGGASGGAFFVMAAWSLGFYRRMHAYHPRLVRAFKSLQTCVYAIATAMLIAAMACLLWDLLYPERALLIFLRPRFTVLTFGAFSLAAELAIGTALAIANVFDVAFLNGRIKRILEVLCCICSVAVITYTGVFLASNASVPFWNTGALIGLFVFSSLSSGISTVLLIDYFVQGQTLLLRAARPLQKCHLACLALETAFLGAFLMHTFTTSAAAKSMALLLEPNTLATAVIGVVGMGIATPFLLELYALTQKECRTIPVSDVVCLIGALLLRWCVIACGVH